jgi:uncharacterized protein YfeS
MKPIPTPLLSLLLLIFTFGATAQNDSGRFEFSLATAHPNAKVLMKEEFFWSPIDETAPFGSDAGSDAAYGFQKWRKNHASALPIIYLKEFIAEWHFPEIAWDELDTLKIKQYMSTPVLLDKSEVERQIKLMKQYNASPLAPGQKQLNDEQLRQIVLNSQKTVGISFLIELDESIIGTSFAQFVLEGKIDPSLQRFAKIALKRETLPILVRQYRADARKSHAEKCAKMLYVISKMHT